MSLPECEAYARTTKRHFLGRGVEVNEYPGEGHSLAGAEANAYAVQSAVAFLSAVAAAAYSAQYASCFVMLWASPGCPSPPRQNWSFGSFHTVWTCEDVNTTKAKGRNQESY